MRKSKYRIIYAMAIIATILSISFSPHMQSYLLLPEKYKISAGDEFNLPLVLPQNLVNNLTLQLHDENGSVTKDFKVSSNKQIEDSGSYIAKLNLFGFIPIKELQVDVMPQIKVYPSGHSIGVVIKEQGVIVVGFSPIADELGREVNPAQEEGILVGDIISKINNRSIGSDQELAEIINEVSQKEEQIYLKIIRNGKIMDFVLQPIKCRDSGGYRIGLYVRDTAAGIGTMTFFEPNDGKYGALGHVIANVDITEKTDQNVGKIMSASILEIKHGKRGYPGEKIGNFNEKNQLSGIIAKNTNFGIYGTLDKIPSTPYFTETLQVAYVNQIKQGKAHILTVLEGDQIEKFEIEIERIIPHSKNNGKGLVIKITDPDLINKTGGIVQGMSGSPIVQNNKLVGAVTHVFVQDPTRGYGILAEWMIEEAGLIPELTNSVLSSAS